MKSGLGRCIISRPLRALERTRSKTVCKRKILTISNDDGVGCKGSTSEEGGELEHLHLKAELSVL